MAASTRRSCGPVIRSLSPSGRFYSPSPSSYSSSSAFAPSNSTFSSRYSTFFHSHRSISPTRVNLLRSASSVGFSIDRPISPSRSIFHESARSQVVKKSSKNSLSSPAGAQKRTCTCSPTTHPGSFRCSFHKNQNNRALSYPSSRLNARRSAVTNSPARTGTVEDLAKRALSTLIRPSSHQQRRRGAFQPSRSRLSVMSKAEDL